MLTLGPELKYLELSYWELSNCDSCVIYSSICLIYKRIQIFEVVIPFAFLCLFVAEAESFLGLTWLRHFVVGCKSVSFLSDDQTWWPPGLISGWSGSYQSQFWPLHITSTTLATYHLHSTALPSTPRKDSKGEGQGKEGQEKTQIGRSERISQSGQMWWWGEDRGGVVGLERHWAFLRVKLLLARRKPGMAAGHKAGQDSRAI